MQTVDIFAAKSSTFNPKRPGHFGHLDTQGVV